MNQKKIKNNFFYIIDILFVMSVIFSIFSNIPKKNIPRLFLPFISYDNLLSLFPITIVILLGIVIILSEKNYKLFSFICISCFIFVFLNSIITVHGLLAIIDMVSENDIANNDSIPKKLLYNLINRILPNIKWKDKLIISELMYSIYKNILNFKDIFLFPIIFLYLYKENFCKAISIFLFGMIFSIIIVLVYEFVEIPFLFGSVSATNILLKINPVLYEINSSHGWWPPLLWYGQLRGPFAEPSYYSYYLGFAVSILIFFVTKKGSILSYVSLFFMCLCTFLTNARSGILLLTGVIVLNIVLISLNLKKIKKVLSILIIVFLAYFISVFLGSYVVRDQNNTKIINENNVVNTIKSVTNPTARSNVSRYGYINATIKIWNNNLFLGTGKDYLGTYISEEMNDLNNISSEMETWIETQKAIGPLNNAYPNLNEYTTSLASGGIIGFILSVSLLGYICIQYLIIIVKRKTLIDNYSILVISMLAVVIAWGMNNYFMVNYLFVISLSLGLCDIYRLKYSYNSDSFKIMSNNT